MKNGYEVVKVVKGKEIYRAIGTRYFYYVDNKVTEKTRSYWTFRTIKAAAKFIEENF